MTVTRFLVGLLAALILALLTINSFAQTTWLINNTTNIGGKPTTVHGNPQVISTPYGNAVLFNGTNDGLVVATNALTGATNFTAEMIFRPDPTNSFTDWQPRIIHIESTSGQRITLEARITNTLWYADTFLKNGGSGLALIDSSKLHPISAWSHLALTYDGVQLKSYVNGVLELSGLTNAPTPFLGGLTSIGVRSNLVNYFHGAILSLRFTPRVLATNEFMCVPKIRYSALETSNETANADFTLTAGLPIGFTLQETAVPGGSWSNSSNATLTTITEGISYRLTVPTDSGVKLFRVVWP